MTVRLAIRGYIGHMKVLEEFPVVDDSGDGMERLAKSQAERMLAMPGGERHMIEIEFLDEPNPLERFFRMGTDPAGMVLPIELKLEGLS